MANASSKGSIFWEIMKIIENHCILLEIQFDDRGNIVSENGFYMKASATAIKHLVIGKKEPDYDNFR